MTIYRVHCPRIQGKFGKLLGYISLCNSQFSIKEIYDELIRSKIIQSNHFHPNELARVPYKITPTSLYGAYTKPYAYSLLVKNREVLYMHPVIDPSVKDAPIPIDTSSLYSTAPVNVFGSGTTFTYNNFVWGPATITVGGNNNR